MIPYRTRAAGAILTVLLAAGCTSKHTAGPEQAASPNACAAASFGPTASSSPGPEASLDSCAPAPDRDDLTVDEEVFAADVRNGRLDCDQGDRAKREIPDCGFYIDTIYVWWSWAAAGKTKPPTGWDYRTEAINAYKRADPSLFASPPTAAPASPRKTTPRKPTSRTRTAPRR